MGENTNFSVYLNKELWEKLQKIAEANGKTRNRLIDEILSDWLLRFYILIEEGEDHDWTD